MQFNAPLPNWVLETTLAILSIIGGGLLAFCGVNYLVALSEGVAINSVYITLNWVALAVLCTAQFFRWRDNKFKQLVVA